MWSVILGCTKRKTEKNGKEVCLTCSVNCHESAKQTDRTKTFGPFAYSDELHSQWVSSSNPVRLVYNMCATWRGLEQNSWASAGHCTRLEAVGWGHLSAASRHRQRLGTFYPWPMFSINPDNVLLTLGFFWKKSLYHWWIVCFSVPGGNESSLAPLQMQTSINGK